MDTIEVEPLPFGTTDYARLTDKTLKTDWNSARIDLDAICTEADRLYSEGKLTVGEVGAIAGLVITRSREIIAGGPPAKKPTRRKRRSQSVG